jgi:penicillin-binding protein 2
MLIFDQLKKNDPQLRLVAVGVLCGLTVLVVGLWWVQIVSARDFQAHLEMQSFRTVRMPAVRGKILDRNGIVLAENRASYNVSLYLEELRKSFDAATLNEITNARAQLKRQMEDEQRRLGRKLNSKEKKNFVLSAKAKELLRQKARYEVASNVVMQISQRLGQPLILDATNFQRHYETRLALPLPIVTNLTPVQIAIFSEQCTTPMGADLEIQSTRFYPFTNTAAHVLGSLRRDERSTEGEDAFFSYRMPDYRGVIGIEFGYDKDLRGKAGVKSVVVNNIGYRQSQTVWQTAEPGKNVILTIDLPLQRKVERALQIPGPNTRGALVVMDVQTGDILAMASSPTLNPNDSMQPLSKAEIERRMDKELRPELNRATQERYAPGSIFKPIVGLACLEAGMDPRELVYNSGSFVYPMGGRPVIDRARAGNYNFREALKHSSNTYFITSGLKAGIDNIIRLGEHLHLNERCGLATQQENPGTFPTLKRISSNWGARATGNICIGQGEIAVTPLQMAVMMSAIANGGKVLFPRLVDRIDSVDPASDMTPIIFEKARVRDELPVKPENLKIVSEAMWADVNESDGTGAKAAVPGMDVCGKTGTAEVMDKDNKLIGSKVWFGSFAPLSKPRYAVVVMIEIDVNAGSGGAICAPIAGSVYRFLQERQKAEIKTTAMARNN